MDFGFVPDDDLAGRCSIANAIERATTRRRKDTLLHTHVTAWLCSATESSEPSIIPAGGGQRCPRYEDGKLRVVRFGM